jgi:riboflavin biosynthesis pyrimidine reductase
MTLTAPQNPLRCIVSHTGKLDPAHPIFQTPGGEIHLLVTGDQPPSAPPQVIVHQTTLTDFLKILAENHGVKNLHCEGGGSLIRELAALDFIDEFHLTVAGHTLFGGANAPTATGIPADFLPASRQFKISHFEPRPELGECFLTYVRSHSDSGIPA